MVSYGKTVHKSFSFSISMFIIFVMPASFITIDIHFTKMWSLCTARVLPKINQACITDPSVSGHRLDCLFSGRKHYNKLSQ